MLIQLRRARYLGNPARGTGVSLLQQLYTEDRTILTEAQYDLAKAFGENPNFAQIDALLPLPLVSQATSPDPGPGFFEIPGARHGSILNPAVGPTVQIVTQAIVFLGTGNIIDAGLRARAVPVEPGEEDHAPYRATISL